VIDLSGFWEIKIDSDDSGRKKDWKKDFEPDGTIGVPGSWNEQLSELGLMNYTGTLWYKKSFYLPLQLSNNTVHVRFDAVDFNATVWLNGEYVGEHEGGYIPFECDISPFLRKGEENCLIVRVNNELSHDSIPQGVTVEDYESFGKERDQSYPPTNFDFFPFGGISRPVRIVSLPEIHLDTVQIETHIEGTHGFLECRAGYNSLADDCSVEIILSNGKELICKPGIPLESIEVTNQFTIPDCQFWNCETPFLYTLLFRLIQNQTIIDEYHLKIGIREVEVTNNTILLNGKPVFLKGFGKHEDFPVLGKGLSYPLIVKDYQLMKWIGANSFRTSHYPYSEEMMQMADRLGFLVIDEVPAVSLNLKYVTDKTLAAHKDALRE